LFSISTKMPSIHRALGEAINLVGRYLVEIHDIEPKSPKAIFDDPFNSVFQVPRTVHDEKVNVRIWPQSGP
jgi:hypothetical protein